MKEWRPIFLARLVGWIVLLGYPVVFVAVLISVWDDPSERGAAAATMTLFAPMLLFAWRGALHPVVRADDHEVTIRNPLGTHRLAWADIEGADAAHRNSPGLLIEIPHPWAG